MAEMAQPKASREGSAGLGSPSCCLSGDESIMDPSVILQAINGTNANSKERVIKRQRRGNRMKVYDNGFIFTYDKAGIILFTTKIKTTLQDSQSGQRSFWRCERKSECAARVHTNPVTNQIIKRINEHTHEAPNREDLPPWLVLSETKSEIPDEHRHIRKDGTTGILINANYSASANSQLAKIIERELDGTEEPSAEVFSSGMEMLIKTEPETESVQQCSSPPKKKKKPSKKEKTTEENEELEALPESEKKLTKKLLELVKAYHSSELFLSENLPQTSSSSLALSNFLKANNLQEYNDRLSKFTVDKLRLLPLADCVSLLKNEPDALLLYHSLRSSFTSDVPSSSTSSHLTIFVSEIVSSDGQSIDEEPLYQMICLTEKTPNKLRLEMEALGLIKKDQVSKLCIEGPNKIKVELNEKMISSWSSESIFHLTKIKKMCLLKRIS